MKQNEVSKLPNHLSQFIIEQNQSYYSSQDQALWRFLVRSVNACEANQHPSHIDGLQVLGISEDQIPSIYEILKKLSPYDWSAVPVTGLLPKSIFFEFLLRKIFPVSVDMRSPSELSYSHEPDIFHDIYGHLPMITNATYRGYLENLSKVAAQIQNAESALEYYRDLWIRELSFQIANNAPSQKVQAIKDKLDSIHAPPQTTIQQEISRLAWWTIEYGVLRQIHSKPKIFGAALLSSIDEAQACVESKIKLRRFGIDCIHEGYDPTGKVTSVYELANLDELSATLEQFLLLQNMEVVPDFLPELKSMNDFLVRGQRNSNIRQSKELLALHDEVEHLWKVLRHPSLVQVKIRTLVDYIFVNWQNDWLLQLELLELAIQSRCDNRTINLLISTLLVISENDKALGDKVRKAVMLYSKLDEGFTNNGISAYELIAQLLNRRVSAC